MRSLLLRASHQGLIQELLWSQPVYLLNEPARTLHDLFEITQSAVVNQLLEQVRAATAVYRGVFKLNLKGVQEPLNCYAIADRKKLLILACDIVCPVMGEPTSDSFVSMQDIVNRFMETVLLLFDRNETQQDPLARNHFEQIQKLNNELVNTHRRLQKANAQLNRLNEILNNRLVKDPLTGLVSRYQYQFEIEQLIQENPDKLGIFLFIDIDDFKSVNDTYGHPIGDIFLIRFAERLSLLRLPGNRICMRISGDEFGVYIHGLDQVDHDLCETIWQRFRKKVIAGPIPAEDFQLAVGCSVGMAVYGQDTRKIYELIEFADFAMYEAKSSGKKQYRRFNRESFEHDRKIKSEIRRPRSDDGSDGSDHQSGIVQPF